MHGLNLSMLRTAGTMAKISYSLGYTAPEVIHAVEAGERHMRATAALDIWSLGVVAFELLTRRRVFAPGTTREQARNSFLAPCLLLLLRRACFGV